MGVNIEDEKLVKMFNPTLKMRETILLFLTVVIDELIWIDSDIGLDTCARGRWINRLIQTQSISLQYTLKKIVELGLEHFVHASAAPQSK